MVKKKITSALEVWIKMNFKDSFSVFIFENQKIKNKNNTEMRLKFVLQTSMDFSLSWQEFEIAQNHHTIWQAHRCSKQTVPQTPQRYWNS